jgi:hypothetical protein
MSARPEGDEMAQRLATVISLAAGVLLVTGAASSAAAGMPAERPLEMTYKAEWGIGTFNCGEGLIPIVIVGEGIASGEISDGVLELTAANGDHLYAAYDGWLIPHDDGTLGCVVYQHYAGGTGRFENAVGEAVERSWITFLSETSGLVEGSVSGSIIYDASDRSS